MSSRTDAAAEEFPPIVPGTSLMLAWRLLSRPVLLIGGGSVATGRLFYLLEAGANVTLIAPREGLSPEIAWRIDVEQKRLAEVKEGEKESGRILWKDRKWEDKDEEGLRDYDLVLTAIPLVTLSLHIASLCRNLRIPVNAADLPPSCDFYFGSQLRRGPLQIMVSTSGRGPRISAYIRKTIEGALPENVERAIDNVGELRKKLRVIVPEAGGEVGKRRMAWMIDVCDAWTLDEFAEMDAGMMEAVLEGWEKGEVRSFEEVSGRKRSLAEKAAKVWGEWRGEGGGWVGVVGGVVLGAVIGAGAMQRFGGLGSRL